VSLLERAIQYTQGEGGPLVVLLHGFAGTAQDLAPFGRSMGVSGHFVFPDGRVSLEPIGIPGRAWWPSDGAARARAMYEGTPRDLSDFEPEGLDEARLSLLELLNELTRETGRTKVVLGGFSQGAMLAFDLAFRTDFPLAALVQLSGCRIAQRFWNPRLATRAGLRTFLSHGTHDPDLSFQAAVAYKDDLVGAGLNVDFHPFEGGHETPISVLRSLKRFLNSV
jgi:phospholipase/carboxylesterase